MKAGEATGEKPKETTYTYVAFRVYQISALKQVVYVGDRDGALAAAFYTLRGEPAGVKVWGTGTPEYKVCAYAVGTRNVEEVLVADFRMHRGKPGIVMERVYVHDSVVETCYPPWAVYDVNGGPRA